MSYEQLRKWAEAQKLREASLAMAEQVSGQLSKDYAIALVKLGDLARKRGALQESTDYYNKALALGDRPEAFSRADQSGPRCLPHADSDERCSARGTEPADAGVRLRAVAGDARAAVERRPGQGPRVLQARAQCRQQRERYGHRA